MTLAQALQNSSAPPDILATQTLIELEFWNFSGEIQSGFLVAHRELETEIRAIFADVLVAQFPIFQMLPVSEFRWSDGVSMAQNNTSAFNYRRKVGKTALSYHATGRAIDINPRQNPYICGDLVLPPGAFYNSETPGTLTENGAVVRAFESRGWVWGGRWQQIQDFHHFEKPAG
ncbi:D-alanyl-D-alanine carboxypeptidase [Abditibacterium utsteinense]|uniref:D-alanyl-D-alanine carboxypeptidase n=1 Tax=Abditibacterium utsteinense TaxID=1960156 RepID=A0A2S8SVG4_9BACT|nr:M15 family metallopeptidase [Abditibacterium utsteinense]PQV64787.1 D-alanyl-D-alanine carboxypeptidase [Abditibacterium utsteinense]